MTNYGRRDRALTGPVWTREYNSFRLADHTETQFEKLMATYAENQEQAEAEKLAA